MDATCAFCRVSGKAAVGSFGSYTAVVSVQDVKFTGTDRKVARLTENTPNSPDIAGHDSHAV